MCSRIASPWASGLGTVEAKAEGNTQGTEVSSRPGFTPGVPPPASILWRSDGRGIERGAGMLRWARDSRGRGGARLPTRPRRRSPKLARRVDRSTRPTRSSPRSTDPLGHVAGGHCRGPCRRVTSTSDGGIVGPDRRSTSSSGSGRWGVVPGLCGEGIDRDVAVKILHRELSSNPTIVARFHREAKVASRLAHPNVVHVLLTGQLPDDAMYMVMGHLDGMSLQSALAASGRAMPLPRAAPRRAGLVRRRGRRLHAKASCHRESSPENVMLVTRAGGRTSV